MKDAELLTKDSAIVAEAEGLLSSCDQAIESKRLFLAVKRIIDVVVCIIVFVCFGWLYFLLWAGVIISSGWPALFYQPRLGRGGVVFKFYKFRSMVKNADVVLADVLKSDSSAFAQWQKFQKLDPDPRVTWFGSLLRKSSLDELPQFWNVFKGDMSLIGPRPCLLSQKDLYGSDWRYYSAIRPGLTGLWQVSGRNRLTYDQRVLLDVQYVKRMSITFDIFIFVKTIAVVVTGHGSR